MSKSKLVKRTFLNPYVKRNTGMVLLDLYKEENRRTGKLEAGGTIEISDCTRKIFLDFSDGPIRNNKAKLDTLINHLIEARTYLYGSGDN